MEKISNGTFDILKQYNIQAKKKFGQNFIHDENTLQSIVRNADVTSDDTIVEIGVGLGALTQLLCENSNRVYGFEIDKSLKPFLEKHLTYDNFTLIFEDFLKVDLKSVLPSGNLKVVANLPYYITTPILFKIVESRLDFTEIYVMMQKEVGERIGSAHKKKSYNALSVILQTKYNISTALEVSKNVFVPKPNVDSLVMKLEKIDKYNIEDDAMFSKFVKSAFEFKRKNLRNNFKGYNKDILVKVLEKLDLDLTARAEQISVEQYVYIFDEYYKEVNDENNVLD